MGLFGPSRDDSGEKRANRAVLDKYTRKMENYSKLMAEFEQTINRLEVVMKDYESREYDKQLSDTNFALDLKYLREQSDLYGEQINQMSELQMRDLKNQIEGTNMLLTSIKDTMDESKEVQESVKRRTRSNGHLLRWIAVSQFLILIGIIFLMLSINI